MIFGNKFQDKIIRKKIISIKNSKILGLKEFEILETFIKAKNN
jgi:hypothetical protein